MDTKRILIIDDSENDYLIFSRYIHKKFDTEYFDGTGDICEKIQQLNPDLVLLDYHLGAVQGSDILKIIKSKKDIPVVILTNEASPEVIVSCMKSGADDYLIKDQLDSNRLIVTITNQLEKAQLQQHVKHLESFLPICSVCKKIREKDADPKKKSSWKRVEQYFQEHTDTVFSHGICPECMEKLYGDFHH